MSTPSEITVQELEERIAALEQATLLLTDFAIMHSMWLARAGTEDTHHLMNQWLHRQVDRIAQLFKDPERTKEHLLRFARLFEQMDSVREQSTFREKLWQDIIQKLRTEVEQ